jgi:hypothetical protein
MEPKKEGVDRLLFLEGALKEGREKLESVRELEKLYNLPPSQEVIVGYIVSFSTE